MTMVNRQFAGNAPLRLLLFLTILVQVTIMFSIEQPDLSSHTLSSNEALFELQEYQPPTLDILSIGSITRLEYLETQQSTFGVEKNIRHFFNATEDDDFDPTCNSCLMEQDITQIIQFCRHPYVSLDDLPTVQKDLIKFFMPPKYMKKKSNPIAWLCAQQRPLAGLMKVMTNYKHHSSFPDYLMIIDDDTYIDSAEIQVKLQHSTTTSSPNAFAGCSMQLASSFMFAHGGYGLVLSKDLLLQLMKPIETKSPVHELIKENHLGEATIFESGMSLLELFSNHAKRNSYINHINWKFPGYCMHSDWAFGYMLAMLDVSLEPLSKQNLCRKEGDKCLKAKSQKPMICHYATPTIMEKLKKVKTK